MALRTFESIRNLRVWTDAVGSTTDPANMVYMGLCSEGSLGIPVELKELMDTQDGTGGLFASYSRVSKLELTLTAKEETADNFKLGFWATQTSGSGPTENVYNLLAAGPVERRVVMKVVNAVKPGDMNMVELYKVKFSPLEAYDLITDDFADMKFVGQVLTNPAAQSLEDKFGKMTVTKVVA